MQALLIQYKNFYILRLYLSEYFRLTIVIRYLKKMYNLIYFNIYTMLFKSNSFMWKIVYRQFHNLLICDFQLSFCTLNHYTKYDLSWYSIILVITCKKAHYMTFFGLIVDLKRSSHGWNTTDEAVFAPKAFVILP